MEFAKKQVEKIHIDGSKGEGGGQIIRSALALSMVTGIPFHIDRIRGKRKKPGLLKQHLTCVKAAREVSNAEVSGDELHSSHLKFTPSAISPREFHFKIGTSGSTTLVLQTILPALMTAELDSRIHVEGGTHNMAAPPFDFLDRCYLPLVEKMGPQFKRELVTHGFFPAGGGKVTVDVTPCQILKPLKLLERGGKLTPNVRALVSKLPRDIGERECKVLQRKSNWDPKHFSVVEIDDSPGPGNVVMIELGSPNVTELFTGFGKRGTKAEDVARRIWRQTKSHFDSGAPVGEYLADQLLLPMGLAAAQGQFSQFRTDTFSQHSQTHIDVLKMFLDIEVDVKEQGSVFDVSVSPNVSEQ